MLWRVTCDVWRAARPHAHAWWAITKHPELVFSTWWKKLFSVWKIKRASKFWQKIRVPIETAPMIQNVVCVFCSCNKHIVYFPQGVSTNHLHSRSINFPGCTINKCECNGSGGFFRLILGACVIARICMWMSMKNPRDLMLMRGVSNCLCPTQSFPCAGAMRGMSMSTNASNSSAVLWSLDSLHCFHSQCTFNDHPPFEIPSAIKRDKLHFVRRGSPLFPWGPEVVQSLWTLHAKKWYAISRSRFADSRYPNSCFLYRIQIWVLQLPNCRSSTENSSSADLSTPHDRTRSQALRHNHNIPKVHRYAKTRTSHHRCHGVPVKT